MASPTVQHPLPVRPGNGSSAGTQGSPAAKLRSPLLARLTSLTSIAAVTAAGLMIVGVLALVGGNYDKQIVRDQLTPQKIFFPPKGSPALLPGVKQYAGQQLVNGSQAKAYANKFIAVHLTEIAGGKTFAQVATAAQAAPKDPVLAGQKAALFQGETLRGLLLSAWGWALIGTIATLAGIILLAVGAVLLLLPLLNARINHGGRS